ncbi:DUF1697 domain-containing protein [Acidobacteriota bacterium]
MSVHISLLRGINVSGQKKIKMEELRALYNSLGFKNVKTFIQSGNVIFECVETDLSLLEKNIESGIKKQFGYDVHVLITTPFKLKEIIDNNPFDEEKTSVTFLSEIPKHIPWDELKTAKHETEKIEISNDVVYIHYPIGIGKTKLSNNFFERKLKVAATSRNLRTINKLWTLSGQ